MKTQFALIALGALVASAGASADTLKDLAETYLGLPLKPEVRVMVSPTSSGALKATDQLSPAQTDCLKLQLAELKAALVDKSHRAADFLRQLFSVNRVRVQLYDSTHVKTSAKTLPHHLKRGPLSESSKTRELELAFSLPANAADCRKTLLTRAAIEETVDRWAQDSGVETVVVQHPGVDHDAGRAKQAPAGSHGLKGKHTDPTSKTVE